MRRRRRGSGRRRPVDRSTSDERRLREIEALRAAGVATWDEEREACEILRRRATKEAKR